MIKEVKKRFMAGLQDGVCPECGNEYADAIDSDEGPGYNHWFERYYECKECGCTFTECFDMVPTAITVDGEV